MITRFNVAGERLFKALADDPQEAVWIDLLNPSREEELGLETALAISLPTREDMDDIALSSRLYSENGTLYMTAILAAKSETDLPEMAPITFILTGTRLITIRYHEPSAFTLFASRAAKGDVECASGEEVMLALLETIIDRLADVLERVSREVDAVSRRTFARGSATTRPPRGSRWRDTLEEIGRKGDLVSNIRDSLGTLERLVMFLGQRLRNEAKTAEVQDRAKDLISDIKSLADHSMFTSGNVTFLLDATLGLINIEQNRIMQIFSVMSVVFLPATLVASIYGMNFDVMPELHVRWGYPAALVLIFLSAVGPYLVFRKKGWL